MNKPKIAYIGTGSMGRPMIAKLLDDGYPVNVYDRYKKSAEPVLSKGAQWHESPASVARDADLVITNLPLPEHVLQNMLGPSGAQTGIKAGATWLDFSTTDYHNTQHIAKTLSEQGVYSLEAPVSNLSHMGVDFCNVSFYVSGAREGYKLAEPVLASMGKISFFVSAAIGEAQTVKLLTNLLFYAGMVVLADVLAAAKLKGIPLLWMWDFIMASRGNSFVAEQVTPFILDGSYDHSCSLEITVKDTDLTVKLADELNVPLPLGRLVEQRYREAGLRYSAHENHVIVAKLAEEANNLDLSVPGFTAPSRYGADRKYVRSETTVADACGRIKPYPYKLTYEAPAALDNAELTAIAYTLTEFMAYVNASVLQEAKDLGRGMGLTEALLDDVIRWSCGSSWIFDHGENYRPDPRIIERMNAYAFSRQATLPVIDGILNLSSRF